MGKGKGNLMPKDGNLTAKFCKTVTEPGNYSDGRGLYFQVRGADSKSWLHRYKIHGKRRESGLGSFKDVSLTQARRARDDQRAEIRKAKDPIEERRAVITRKRAEEALSIPFRDIVEKYIERNRSRWKIPPGKEISKSEQVWRSSLERFAYPVIGDLPASEITIGHIDKILEPLFASKPETARKLQQRLALILDLAKVLKFRSGENPATWKGNLEHVFPDEKNRESNNHKALPIDECSAFMAKLRKRESMASSALEYIILTNARQTEALWATWDEINLKAKVWKVPAARMKAGEEHEVPLSARAIEILEDLPRIKGCDFLFPGHVDGKPLTEASTLKLLRKLAPLPEGERPYTVHGFRSTFRDWAGDNTAFDHETIERAMAHKITSETERAYRRGTALEKRRRLMEAWAGFLQKPPAKDEKIVSIRSRRKAS